MHISVSPGVDVSARAYDSIRQPVAARHGATAVQQRQYGHNI
jgi:hypothetical protein